MRKNGDESEAERTLLQITEVSHFVSTRTASVKVCPGRDQNCHGNDPWQVSDGNLVRFSSFTVHIQLGTRLAEVLPNSKPLPLK